MRSTLLLLLALLQPAPPAYLSAQWDTASSATIQWTQDGRGCLSRESAIGERVFVGCFDRTATIVLELGHAGALDAAYRPRPGDVFVLQTGDQTYRAPLVGRPVYLPTIR